MRRGRIASVEFLAEGSDNSLIEQAKAHFLRRSEDRFDGFEVWYGARFVYREPPDEQPPNSN
jgi:hypothetical protein